MLVPQTGFGRIASAPWEATSILRADETVRGHSLRAVSFFAEADRIRNGYRFIPSTGGWRYEIQESSISFGNSRPVCVDRHAI